MGFGSKIGGIAKKLTLGTIKAGKYASKKMVGVEIRKKRRAGSTSRTSVDITARKKKDYRKLLKEVDRKGMRRASSIKRKMKAMTRYKGAKGMKRTGKNKPVTSIADRMQARRRRTSKAKRRSPTRPYSGKPMNLADIKRRVAEAMKKRK